MENEILLQLKNIKVHYGGVRALDDVDIDLDEGEIVSLMGPNGAGKSTILKAIFGLAPIKNGEVIWESKVVEPISHKMVTRGISFVPQGRRVFTNLTVKENLEVGAFMINDKSIIKTRIERVLDLFPELKIKLNSKSGYLSGGQQQMVAVARGLMTDPKVLLLDEPSLGLSPKNAAELFKKIIEINQKRKTAIMIVEHNIQSVLCASDRGYVLANGRIVANSPSDKILSSGILEKVFSGKIG